MPLPGMTFRMILSYLANYSMTKSSLSATTELFVSPSVASFPYRILRQYYDGNPGASNANEV